MGVPHAGPAAGRSAVPGCAPGRRSWARWSAYTPAAQRRAQLRPAAAAPLRRRRRRRRPRRPDRGPLRGAAHAGAAAVPGAAGDHVRDLPAGVALDVRRRPRGDARLRHPDAALRADAGRRDGRLPGARPATLLAIVYKPDYGEGAAALPILVLGECCLAMLAVSCAILNAAGRAAAAHRAHGDHRRSSASAPPTCWCRRRAGRAMLGPRRPRHRSAWWPASWRDRLRAPAWAAGCRAASVLRVGASVAVAVARGAVSPRRTARSLGLVRDRRRGMVYVLGLLATGELGAEDRAKLQRILRRR